MPEHRLNKECHTKLYVDFKRKSLGISSLEAGRRKDNKITRLAGKAPRYGKTKTYVNKPSKWLKRVINRDQENVSLFEFGLIVPAVLKCLF